MRSLFVQNSVQLFVGTRIQPTRYHENQGETPMTTHGTVWPGRHKVTEEDRQRWREEDREWSRLAQIYQCILEDTQRGHAYRRVNGRWQVPYHEDRWRSDQ